MSWLTDTIQALHGCQIDGHCGPIPHWVVILGPIALAILFPLFIWWRDRK